MAKHKPLSLTRRFLLGALVWVVCSLLATGFLLNQLFQQHVEEQLRKELNVHLMQLITQVSLDSNLHLSLTQPLSDPRFARPLGGLYWQIESDQPLAMNLYSRSLWDESLKPPAAQAGQESWFRYVDPELGELYVLGRSIYAAEASAGTYQFWMAAQKDLIAEPLQRFRQMLILALTLLGSVLVAGVWGLLRLGLRPMRQLRRSLSAVHEGERAFIEGQYPQEIQPLVSEFNRVLHSHGQVVERARTQAGNLAHAVKTPLAVLANAAKQENTDLAQLVTEQVTQAQQQVDYHLSRARVAASVKTVGVRTEVIPAIHSLTKLLQRAYEHKVVQVHISEADDTLYFKGEAQDLHEMLGNVLDNAFKWCATTVQVHVQRQPTQLGSVLMIRIDDDGVGLQAEQYTQVFKRGVRADELAPGSGLGLAIVTDLVQLYGGAIKAMRSPLGGLRIQIQLP